MVEYEDASPEVRTVYDDIRKTRNTDLVNNFWKALASHPPTLRRTQGNRIWSLRLLKADGASWRSGAINSDRGCRNGEEPASVRSFARSKGSSASNHLPNFSYAIALSRIRSLALSRPDRV